MDIHYKAKTTNSKHHMSNLPKMVSDRDGGDESGRSWRSAGVGPGRRRGMQSIDMEPFLKHPICVTGQFTLHLTIAVRHIKNMVVVDL